MRNNDFEGPMSEPVRFPIQARRPDSISRDPVLAIEIDAIKLAADKVGPWHHFLLPSSAGWRLRSYFNRKPIAARLLSRSAVPSSLTGDTRLLGVAVGDVELDGEKIELSSNLLGGGWYGLEKGFRWTNGAGEITIGNACRLSIHIAVTVHY